MTSRARRALTIGIPAALSLLSGGCAGMHGCCRRSTPAAAASPACCPEPAPTIPASPVVPVAPAAPAQTFSIAAPGGCCGNTVP